MAASSCRLNATCPDLAERGKLGIGTGIVYVSERSEQEGGARALADLAGAGNIRASDVLEAIQYRSLDHKLFS